MSEIGSGRFSLSGFYERRARRILPALFFVMMACLPFALMWMLPSEMKDFSRSIISVIFFSSNILFWREDSYFAANAELKPLLHTWSLSVEEQFYIIFPVFLIFVWRLGSRNVMLILSAVTLCSLALAEWGSGHKPTATFYLAPTRAWELLAGALCALLMADKMRKPSNALSAAGLAMIVFAVLAYDSSTPFPGLYTLVPVVGAALIILYAREGTWVARLLSMRAFVGIGLISYSAYLWHQPLFAFARLRSITEPSHGLMATLAVAVFLLAWGTWRWVEQPFRRSVHPVLATRRRVFAASCVVGAAFVVVGVAGHAGWRLDGSAVGDVRLADMEQRLVANHGLHSDCEGAQSDSPNCSTSPAPNVILWGDSFAMHLAQGIVASEEGIALRQHTMSVCAPVLGIAHVGPGYREDRARRCIEFNARTLGWLREREGVDLVILSSAFSQLLGNELMIEDGRIIRGDDIDFVAGRIINTVRAIMDTGARVIIVSQSPNSKYNIGRCLLLNERYRGDSERCNFSELANFRAFEMLRRVEGQAAIYWLNANICSNGVCDVMQDGVFIYRDSGHLSKEGSAYLGRRHDWMANFRREAF